jgi:membrane protein
VAKQVSAGRRGGEQNAENVATRTEQRPGVGGRREGERYRRVDPRDPKGVVKAMVAAFEQNDLLTYASAIANQTLYALVPLALAGLALLGFLDLEDVWQRDVAPQVQERVSTDAFQVIEQTVDKILRSGQSFWLTLGAALAVWAVSGAVRALMGVLSRIYEADGQRSFWRRYLVSFALALVVIAGVAGAGIAVEFLPRGFARIGDATGLFVVGQILRWVVAAALLVLVVGILIRFAPARVQPIPWVGLGSLLVVGSWIVATIGFVFYVTSVANYSSVFGSLSVVIVLMTYLYVASIAFLVGAQLDALIRAQVRAPGGAEPD